MLAWIATQDTKASIGPPLWGSVQEMHIFAIGDCARHPCLWTGERRRIESIQNAQDQARHVASVIVGAAPAPYAAAPWFWSEQGADKLQMVGALIDGATCERVDAAQGDGFSIWRRLGDRLVACESVNDAKTHMRARRELAAQMAA